MSHASSRPVRRFGAAVVVATTALAGVSFGLLPQASAATSDWADPSYTPFATTGTPLDTVVDQAGAITVLSKRGTGAYLTRITPGQPVFQALQPVAQLTSGALATSASATYFLAVDTSAHQLTVRKLIDGDSPDPAFGTGGKYTLALPSNQTAAITALADGTLIVGRSTSDAGLSAFTTELRALTPAGAPVTTFGTNGVANFPGQVQALAADGNRTVVVTGGLSATTTAGRLTTTGQLDTTFGTAGVTTFTGIDPQRVITSDGAVLISGRRSPDASNRPAVLKLGSDGKPVTGFGTNGTGVYFDPLVVTGGLTSVQALASGSNTYLILQTATGPLRIHRLTSAGVLDTTYDGDGRVITDTAYGRTVTGGIGGVRSDGRLVVALDTRTVSGGTTTAGYETALLSAGATTTPGSYVPLAPQRLLDTRSGVGGTTGPVGNTQSRVDLQVGGVGGVPKDAKAVTLNVTAVSPSAAAAVTVFPTPAPGAGAPGTSNLNPKAGRTTSNLVTVALGVDGKVSFNVGSIGKLHLLADVAGYYRGGTSTDAGALQTVDPYRALDTRAANGPTGGRAVAPGGTVTVEVGSGNASAVVVNLTAVTPAAAAAITAYPYGTAAPTASNLNADAGVTTANLATVKLGQGGRITLRNGSTGATHLLADVVGVYVGGTPSKGGTFVALAPGRVLDTRAGLGAAKAPVTAGQKVTLSLADVAGVPRSRVGSVLLNTTVTQPTGGGLLTTYATGTAVPGTSSLNYMVGQTVAGLAAIRVDTNSRLDIQVAGSGTTQLIGDVSGYFLD